MKKIAIVLGILITQFAFGATLKGRVKDMGSSEPLVGATVVLKDTKMGSAAGLDGSFEIKNVPVGTYEIVVSYIGYAVKTQTIEVKTATETLTFDFDLSDEASLLSETVVTAQADRENDFNVRKSEQKADNVVNIIGAKAIQLLPDITVGNVLQRVSGVSVVRNSSGDGQYAIIRGMDKRYNYTLVNGIKIPSSDNKNRYVPMDIFPAEMLERLEVVKALTPNMEGDAIGGAMNMVMKSAPDHRVLSATASTGYSQIFSDRPFSGFSSSGIAFQSPAQKNGNNYIAQVSDFSTKTLQYTESQPLNTLLGLTYGDRILNKKLGYLLGASYQNTYRGSNTLYYLANGQPSADPAPNTPLFERVERRQFNTQQTRTGIHAKLDYVFNKNHKLSLYNLFLQLDENQHRHVENLNFGVGDQSINDRSRFTRQNIYNTTLQGDHQFGEKLKLNWSAVYSLATSKTPDWTDMSVTYRVVKNTKGEVTDSTRYVEPVNHTWLQNQDEDKSGYVNATYNVFKNVGIFKDFDISVGGMYRNKQRSNYYTDYSLNTVLPGGDRQVFSSIEKTQFIFRPLSNAIADTTNGNNYNAIENITAGYIQAKLLAFNKLQIVGGMRAENTAQSYESQLPVSVIGKNGSITYLDLLPSVHFKYALNPKQNLRLSYFKSISRPGYFEFIPANIVGDYFNEGGNYNIKHTVADNIDLRYEFFPTGNNHLLAGAFFKNIENPIEYGFAQVGNNSFLYTPQNFGTATNYGFELVFAKYIKNWGISGNYTYTHSEITTTKKVYYRDGTGSIKNAPPTTVEYPTPPTQTRPLQGQSDHIGNLSLIYKNANLGIDAQIAWVYTGARINIVSAYKDLDYWQKATSQLDFSTEKRFKGGISIFLKVTNLLDNPIVVEILKKNTLIGNVFPEQTDPNSILVQKDEFKRSFLVGIRYKIQ
jgi:outer membrane receptor protein involved in Fe transport